MIQSARAPSAATEAPGFPLRRAPGHVRRNSGRAGATLLLLAVPAVAGMVVAGVRRPSAWVLATVVAAVLAAAWGLVEYLV